MTDDKDKQWTVLESEYLIRRPWLTARRDWVRLQTAWKTMNITCWSIRIGSM